VDDVSRVCSLSIAMVVQLSIIVYKAGQHACQAVDDLQQYALPAFTLFDQHC
jgi:hypothetical protein